MGVGVGVDEYGVLPHRTHTRSRSEGMPYGGKVAATEEEAPLLGRGEADD